jgi:hypothetical protein
VRICRLARAQLILARIAPVGVGHSIAGFYDTRQRGDIGGLFVDFQTHVPDDVLAGIDNTGNPHGALGLHMPCKL